MSAYSVDYDKSANQQCQIHFESKQQCACASESDPTRHRACHQARARKFVLSVALLLLAVGATLVISCVAGDIDLLDVISLGADVSGGPLDKRSTSSSFTQNKRECISRHAISVVVVAEGSPVTIVYLIIVFVGLFLVLIAGIMLSYWCCKGKIQSCWDVNHDDPERCRDFFPFYKCRVI